MHEGHRKRMLERVESRKSLQDHELLEIILYNPIPRKNTNEIAHRLLTAFGSLRGVFRADEVELERIEGVGKSTAQYLKHVGELYRRLSVEEDPVPKAYNYGDFAACVRERFEGLSEEAVDLFCLDRNDRVTYMTRFTSGEESRVELAIEDISRVLVAHHPFGIAVSHNHPGTACRPSSADDAFTAQLQLLCSLNKVRLCDHVIVGADGMYSYFMHGRLEEMEVAYSVENIIRAKNIR